MVIITSIPEDDAASQSAYLNFYLDVDEDKEKVLADVRAALAEIQKFLDLGESTPSQSLRQRTRTGSTTGNSISNSSMWTTF